MTKIKTIIKNHLLSNSISSFLSQLKILTKKSGRFLEILPVTWIILSAQNLLFIFKIIGDNQGLENVPMTILFTNLAIIFFVQGIHALSFSKNYLIVFINVLLTLIYAILFIHQFTTGVPVDFFLISENWGNLKYEETREMILNVDALFLFQLGLVIILIIYSQFHFKYLTRTTRSSQKLKLVVGALGYILLLFSSYTKDQLVLVSKSFYAYNFAGNHQNFEIPEGTIQFPYLHVNEVTEDSALQDNPHVFLIMMESCNSFFIESKRNGKEVTPFLNSLIKKGVYAEKFFSNSVYTTKGHFSTLTGLSGSFKKNIFMNYPSLNVLSIPQILNKRGYHSIFFSGHNNLNFASEKPFLKRMAFNDIKQMDAEFITEKDLEHYWGWGIQDDITYKKFFSFLDKRHKEVNKPFFSSLATISHHYDFSNYPKHLAYVYPHAKSGKEHFANSMYIADRFLKTFFEELKKRDYLKNSIVIITGDHGFPSQGLSTKANGGFIYSGFTNDRFKIPLLILQEGKLKPKRLNKAFTQIDIAPSLLDLLQIKTLVPFQGTSVFAENKEEHIIDMVQPYDGTYLITLLYPYKYVLQETTGKELVFNIETDPLEEKNILSNILKNKPDLIKTFRNNITKIYTNQRLIEQNRIWP